MLHQFRLHDTARAPQAADGPEQHWPETSCYADLWIELLHGLRLEPLAMFGFAIEQDYEGDQFTFVKPRTQDIATLYGLSVQELTIYDTLDNNIGGFGQQQSYGGSFTFSSQYGIVDVASLPVVSVNGVASGRPAAPPQFDANVAPPDTSGAATDVFGAIEKLAALHSRGILNDAEFATKKAELLSRL